MKPEEFKNRRRQLMRMIGDDAIAILPAAPVRKRNRDIDYHYRQDSDFFYLSGFEEPDAVIVLAPGRASGEFVLFCRDKDPQKELWDGVILGPDAAVERLGADDAFPVSDIDEILPGLLESRERVYFALGVYPEFDQQLTEWLKALQARGVARSHTPQEIVSLNHYLHDMRLYKSPKELSAMRRAAKITVRAHERAIRRVEPGLHEYELEAEFDYEFRRNNARHAYPPIVGAGENACILHYTANDQRIRDGDLIMIDAGCELDYYASDVSRTFPANGRFSGEQKALYEVVLRAQLAAIREVQSGQHWNVPHDAALATITEGLLGLGILQGELNELIEVGACKPYFMHRTGHWLGMDVHDVGDYRVGDEWRVLEPGMVTTVEPGIYIGPEAPVDQRWRGIGVRIEDDVAVTRRGPDVLSKGLAKTVDDIEALANA